MVRRPYPQFEATHCLEVFCKGCGKQIWMERGWRLKPLSTISEGLKTCQFCGRRLETPRAEDIRIEMVA